MSAATLASITGAVTLVLSALLPFVIRPLLVRLGIMDVPNARSSHDRPILRGLGLAVLLAMAIGGAFGVSQLITPTGTGWQLLAVVLAGLLAAGFLGLGEDLKGLSVAVRSLWLLGIAAASAGCIAWIATRTPDASFSWVLALDARALPVWVIVLLCVYAVFFISSYINVANFMDGLNGISGFHGVIAGVTFAFAGWWVGAGWLLVAGTVVAAGFAGFLPWNLSKPGAFLGDVGSYLLGGAVAVTSFAALMTAVPLLATIGPMVIYFGDVAVTLVKRVRAGHRWDEPHKEHAYQRIQQLGYSHVQASGITAICTLATSLLGLASLFTSLLGTLVLLAAGLVVLIIYLALPRLLPRRH
ncbi:UDP-phosphate alpha-N-acetyl-D-fucosaminephosphotransferase [Leucobacter sp. USHLN153]|uniref:UDP-phosphate alpha-N-acetyl-D-fucosaminephosphotransferase n=1 Tax=Leucobacter sp. USHLN153 TaxID=3081268 RepID=UPI003019B3AD